MQKKLLPAVVLALASMFAFGCSDEDDDAVLVDDGVVTFNDLDLNDDGFVSAAEIDEIDDEFDLDGDGFLDEDEFLLTGDDFDDFDIADDAFLSDAELSAAKLTVLSGSAAT